MNKDILVCYLFTKFDKIDDLSKFLKYYKINNSGVSHILLICFKNISKIDKLKCIQILDKNVASYDIFEDDHKNNDFDFGSYLRISIEFKNRIIFFLNASSFPIKNNWLKLIKDNYNKKTIVATSASYESHLSSLRLKKYYKFFSFAFKYLRNYFFFHKFPNPHIRTTGFMINSNDLVLFLKNKICNNKFDAWKIESGKNGLTQFFLKNKYKILIVNSDGKIFEKDKWAESNTYFYKEKPKSIISDKHTRKYDLMANHEKKKLLKNVWGN